MKNKTTQMKLAPEKNVNKLKYYAAFSYLPLRPLFKAKLLEYFDFDVEKAFNADKNDLENFRDYQEVSVPREFLSKRDKLDIDECFNNAFLDEEVKIVTVEDDLYPSLLRQIPDYPISLYYKGNIENQNSNLNLAVVGSRKASQEAKIALDNIISDFNSSDITVVSGLAYGIDAQAHKSALNNNIRTFAVIGSGLDIIYPNQNKDLFYEIINSNGAVFSEYPLKTSPIPMNFPQRNRIVVGMSKGTLVAEARIKSGAMISANLTLDFNRELMCIPGNISNPNTSGIYYLIKNGAGIVTSSEDILNQMDWNIKATPKESIINLSALQKNVLNCLSLEPKTFDEVMIELKEDISKIMVTLTELEVKGLIKQSNNKYYKL